VRDGAESSTAACGARRLRLSRLDPCHHAGALADPVHGPGPGPGRATGPGYPFLAAPFQALGVIRLAPLFYGALGCLGLFAGARRWLGRFGGAAAVGLFCASGTALLFAWRDYMATFTDASLIAAGTGALLWALLAEEGAAQRRTWIGLAGFVAIEAAVLVRYTNIVMLACAVAAVLVGRWRPAASVPRRALGWWLGSVALFGMGVAAFDDLVYGGLLSSGYRPGEITFSLGAVVPNLRYMPAHLIDTMPMMLLALAGLAWIGGRWTRLQRAVRRWPRRHRPPPWWQRSGWASGPSTRCRTHRTQAPHRRPTAMSGSRIAPALSPQISGGSGRGQRK
jgi:hypothetical protein